jgi:hypothetical protein
MAGRLWRESLQADPLSMLGPDTPNGAQKFANLWLQYHEHLQTAEVGCPETHGPSQLSQLITPLACILEAPYSNLDWETDYFD